ncbi:type II toxin-antitoxin system PemK/MazF family toxin [Desulfobacterota bacterium AH_259_B03_O07]|nr:type II toxin-antitoxin system PemK/MazF family toxin [Desulfobacterota bacterium AH_259_B03_O07]
MNRGEVWWINFDPSVGGEIKKKRPATILSNDVSNKYLNRIQAVLLSSNIDRLYPREAYVTLNINQNKAMADQLTTVSKSRFVNLVGKISTSEMRNVEKPIIVQLGISI